MKKKSQFFSTKEETIKWLDKYHIKNYTINDDLTVDVDDDVDISYKNLKTIPIKFGKVTGDFWCDRNKLKTLFGSPKSVIGSFGCHSNKITALAGSPETIGGSFSCSYNPLTNLSGSPKSVGVSFYCSYSQLESLIGSPETVGGNFECHVNKLANLKGIPVNIAGYFLCFDNELIDATDFLNTNIDGVVILGLNEKIFKNKNLYNFLNKYFNKPTNRIKIKFKILKLYLEKLELEKNLKGSNNIKLKKVTKKSYL